MFFKNITVFKLLAPIDRHTLSSALADFKFTPCHGFNPESIGWVHPFIKDQEVLCHDHHGFALLCLQTEEKILPTSVITQHTDERVQEIETLQNTKVGKHERTSIRRLS